jgi:hypothetical protein
MVQSLLSSYLIDTPMAYRLLYGRTIRATAIDDNRFLGYNAPRVLRPPAEQFKSLQRFEAAVQSLDVGDAKIKNSLLSAVRDAMVFLDADINEATDERAVAYYELMAKSTKALAETALLISASGIKFNAQADAEALGRDSLAYDDEAQIFRFAVQRNGKMAEQIIAASHQPLQSIPIAFIGNFHTAGITTVLRQNGIGYAVIEPRPRVPVSRSEVERFNRAVHRNTAAAYLATVRLRKLKVAPTITDVRTIYRPKMVTKGAALKSEIRAVQDQVAAISGAKLDTKEFITATGENGSLAGLRLSFNDESQPPLPPEFKGAFAYFEPGGPSGRHSAFVVTDSRDGRWSSPDRYTFLRAAVFPPRSDPAVLRVVSEETFYPDLVHDLMYYTIFDQKSGRIYCFEERLDGNRRTSLIPLPITTEKGGTNIRMQVVEVSHSKEKSRG